MDSNNYDFLIYKRGNETKEAKSIELKIPNEMTCDEFKIMCVRMAHAIGYHQNSVAETFGKIKDKLSNANQLKLLLKD
tara:strand:- start:4168 stop:4401 length:234 start_codon:yes stop_codon:yes gene_type:complete